MKLNGMARRVGDEKHMEKKMNLDNAKNKKEPISYQQIIFSIRNLKENELLDKKPEIVTITEYIYNQTIIVKGKKEYYRNIIEFWMSFLSWFHEDEIMYDDFSKYPSEENLEEALKDKGRIGLCEEINLNDLHFHGNNFLKYIDCKTIEQSYIMNPSWDSKKLLATTEDYYYGYNWWTGE